MAEFIFIHLNELDLTINALYAASDVVVNYDRDFDAAIADNDYNVRVIERARDLELLIDDDGNITTDLTIVMPAAFIRFIERDALYLVVIDFEGIAGVIDASEDHAAIPDIIRHMLDSRERYTMLDDVLDVD